MSKPLEVLIVEDNRGDANLISELLDEMGLPLRVTLAMDGQKALDILRGENSSYDTAPDFVILDLNLPKVNGFDILKS